MIIEDRDWLRILPAGYAPGQSLQQMAGKWLCFGKQWEIRSFIPRIERLVEDGTFKAAKISKKHSRSNSSERKECVLCVYTSDNPEEKSAVYEKLQQIGLRPKSWKSDMETLLDLGRRAAVKTTGFDC
jgi:hypothetical protein